MNLRRIEQLRKLIQFYGLRSLVSGFEYLMMTKIPTLSLFKILYLPNGFKILIPGQQDYLRGILSNYGEIYVQGISRRHHRYVPDKGEVVLDIGAFIGLHTLDASFRVGDEGVVYAIEPNPLSFHLLTMNVGLNKLKNIEALPVAFGRSRGQQCMSYTGLPTFFSLYLNDNLAKQRVMVWRLDDFVSFKRLSRIDIAKIDAEGAELDILIGASSTLERGIIDRLVIEGHKLILNKVVYKTQQLVSILSCYGYAIDGIYDIDAYSSIIYARHHR